MKTVVHKTLSIPLLWYLSLLLSLLLSMTSCNDAASPNTPAPTYTLQLDIQDWFRDDNLRISIDGKQILERRFNSNPSLGLAGIVSVSLSEGQHILSVECTTKNVHLQQQFTQKAAKQWVGIRYDTEEKTLHFRFQDTFFGYD